jgi:aspartyl-tRNA synthetase
MRTLIGETLSRIGELVTLKGWVSTKRDHGKLTFIDLRDRTGTIQSVGYQKMGELTTESVVEIIGTIKARNEKSINPELPLGAVEIDVQEYTILGKANELPIQVKEVEGNDVSEDIRLKYRYLDLRRVKMQKIMKLRSQYSHALRQGFIDRDFIEVETPILSKATMEGARDFLVPSRFQHGKFYALPQSPQQYKQLTMVAGVDRYFQFARCFRDEDLRADRGFEFTQVDVEMSFVTSEEIRETMEQIVKQAVKSVGGKLKDEIFPVYAYPEAIEQFGADKFDLRSEDEKKDRTLAFAWVTRFPFFKKVDKADAAELRDGKSGWTFTHNPFGAPIPEHMEWHLKGEHIDEIIADQYDLVCNGYEVGGGGIRAHKPDLLASTYRIMGYSEAETQASIGHMLEAFSYGTPPHGGIALGLDRQIMLLSGESSLKEAIAFPMTSTGRTAVMDGPSAASVEQLIELGLNTDKSPQDGEAVYQLILSRIKTNKIDSFKEYKHISVLTSEEAAVARNTTIEQGAKALVMYGDKQPMMLVLSASTSADLHAFKQLYKIKDLRMASKDEVKKITNLEVGSIPPYGSIFKIPTYVDGKLSSNEEIVFSAGLRTKSIKMKYADWLKLENPTVGNFSK